MSTESLRSFSKRFIPFVLHQSLNDLVEQLRSNAKKGAKLTVKERTTLVAILVQTGAIPGYITKETIVNALIQRLPTLYFYAGTVRTGIPTGFRAPELVDRGDDTIQAAFWIMDELEKAAPLPTSLSDDE